VPEHKGQMFLKSRVFLETLVISYLVLIATLSSRQIYTRNEATSIRHSTIDISTEQNGYIHFSPKYVCSINDVLAACDDDCDKDPEQDTATSNPSHSQQAWG
jgi:hypothetical protein